MYVPAGARRLAVRADKARAGGVTDFRLTHTNGCFAIITSTR